MKQNFLLVCLFSALVFTGCKEDDETPPRATANFDFNNCEAPCTVNFINISQNATSYSWNFGDGTTSTEVNPKHLYETAGTYNVKLEATGEGGSHVREKSVVISAPVFHLKYKVDGTLVEANLISATRNNPQGFLEIASSAPSLSPPYFYFLIKEPAGGFGSEFNLALNQISAADSTVATYTNFAGTSYSSVTDANGIALQVNYLNYTNGGIISGTFSGSLKNTSGNTVNITEGSLKIQFSN